MTWFFAIGFVLALFCAENFRIKAVFFEKESGYWRNRAMRDESERGTGGRINFHNDRVSRD